VLVEADKDTRVEVATRCRRHAGGKRPRRARAARPRCNVTCRSAGMEDETVPRGRRTAGARPLSGFRRRHVDPLQHPRRTRRFPNGRPRGRLLPDRGQSP
jgi:hypothetical protein